MDINTINKLNNLLVKNIDSEKNLRELEQILLNIVNFDSRKLNNLSISEVKIKGKTAPKKFNYLKPGQVFEIYLKEINRYSYCVIVEENENESEVLIAYLNLFSELPSKISEIFDGITGRNLAFIANSSIYSIKNKRWKFVSTYYRDILTKEEIRGLVYKAEFMGKIKFIKALGTARKLFTIVK